ncbi:mitochondrial 37S ribosomal protein mS38 SCDLUD_000233 [Saccharomycodes ludwigii]|uniref:mitochondrial 37S ribosomal protein mS38 n=1 Tax=Saccharomycodes ludwigii TaxID=36035 RepID=UPI001E8A14B5|nr:hypothetical protein SCDLUD_000233 [Saccharomycodes ludwigii]KAH3902651.1 hypothetical protein SCDLUD_000233 [Saccharomycodes ludwigii]
MFGNVLRRSMVRSTNAFGVQLSAKRMLTSMPQGSNNNNISLSPIVLSTIKTVGTSTNFFGPVSKLAQIISPPFIQESNQGLIEAEENEIFADSVMRKRKKKMKKHKLRKRRKREKANKRKQSQGK